MNIWWIRVSIALIEYQSEYQWGRNDAWRDFYLPEAWVWDTDGKLELSVQGPKTMVTVINQLPRWFGTPVVSPGWRFNTIKKGPNVHLLSLHMLLGDIVLAFQYSNEAI